MVSLGEDSRGSGGYFFDQAERSFSGSDRDHLLDEGSALKANRVDDVYVFKPICTAWITILAFLTLVGLLVLAFILPATYQDVWTGSPFSAIVYAHAGMWFLFLLVDSYVRRQHHILRQCGYLEFYRQTRIIRRLPLLVYSAGCAFLLLLVAILQEYCTLVHDVSHKTKSCFTDHTMTRCNFLQAQICVEVLVIGIAYIVYLVHVVRFNRSESPPDIHEDELTPSGHQLSNEIGFRDDALADDLLEKQADLIRYLKQHNASLGRRILKLTEQISNQS